MAERSATLGRVVVRGEDVELELEDAPTIEIARGDRLVLNVLYDFDDDPDARETLRLRLDVTIDGRREGTAEAVIRDAPMVDDSHRGALSLPVRGAREGAEGAFVLRVDQELAAWRGGAAEDPFREGRIAHGTFRLRVR